MVKCTSAGYGSKHPFVIDICIGIRDRRLAAPAQLFVVCIPESFANRPLSNSCEKMTSSGQSLSALYQELQELDIAIDVPPRAGTQPSVEFSRLRQGLDAQTKLVEHEVARFALVCDSAPNHRLDAQSAIAVCKSLGEATALLVSLVQVLTRPSSTISGVSPSVASLCPGDTFTKDVRSCVRGILRAISAMVQAAGDGGSGGGRINSKAVVGAAGMVFRLCEAVPRLPTNVTAAARRKILNTAKLIKTSVGELREDHGLPAPAAAATAASTASASAGSSAATGAQQLTPVQSAVNEAITVLKACMDIVKAALDGSDASIASAGSATGLEAAVSGLAITSSTPDTSSASSSSEEAAAATTLDTIAALSHTLHDAIIDYAAAASDVGADGNDTDLAALLGLDDGGEEAGGIDEEDEDADEDDDEGDEQADGAAAGDEADGGSSGPLPGLPELQRTSRLLFTAAEALVQATVGLPGCGPTAPSSTAAVQGLAELAAAVGALPLD